MKRWFIAKLGDYENEGTRVPATNKYRPNGTLRADLLNDPNVPSRIWTKPGFNWCFGQLAASNITLMQADPDIAILPDSGLDTNWSALPSNVRVAVINRVTSAGFAFSPQSGQTIRQVLMLLVAQIQPTITSVEQGDVEDVTT